MNLVPKTFRAQNESEIDWREVPKRLKIMAKKFFDCKGDSCIRLCYHTRGQSTLSYHGPGSENVPGPTRPGRVATLSADGRRLWRGKWENTSCSYYCRRPALPQKSPPTETQKAIKRCSPNVAHRRIVKNYVDLLCICLEYHLRETLFFKILSFIKIYDFILK